MRITPTLPALLLFASPLPSFPCTTAAFHSEQNQLFVAKNLDWNYGHGFVAVNPSGAKKTALLLPQSNGASPLEWKSKFGSVSFNQVARNFPFGGMNEKGFLIEVMWLTETKHPPLGRGTPAVNESQYMQYLLDQSATTAEAISLTEHLQIQKGAASIHYLMCDPTEDCAVVEFVDGHRRVYRGESLPYRALTNNNYQASRAFLANHVGFGGRASIPTGQSSLERFVIAVSESQKRQDPLSPQGQADPFSKGFSLLEKVMLPTAQWQIVYQPGERKIQFRSREGRQRKTLDLQKLSFACAQGFRYRRLAEGQGDVTGSFSPLSTAVSEQNIRASGFIPENIKKLLLDFEKKQSSECAARP